MHLHLNKIIICYTIVCVAYWDKDDLSTLMQLSLNKRNPENRYNNEIDRKKYFQYICYIRIIQLTVILNGKIPISFFVDNCCKCYSPLIGTKSRICCLISLKNCLQINILAQIYERGFHSLQTNNLSCGFKHYVFLNQENSIISIVFFL